jgi:predicted P-loop ATPase
MSQETATTARRLSDITPDDNKIMSLDRIKNITDAINYEFDIKMNIFDKSKSIITSKNNNYKDGVITVDEVSLHLYSMGVNHSDTILRKILKSPHYTKMYNPIEDYFNSLKYDGVSHIDILCNHLKAREFGDKKKGYYQSRFNKLFKKWLVAVVACSFGAYKNEVLFGLVHTSEGIGKSFFFEFLSQPLRDYYITVTDKKEQKLNLTEAFVKNFLINFDELCGIDKRNPEPFKNLLSSPDLLIKERNDPFPVKRKRIGSAAFTSNKNAEMGGFLTPDMGYRRFGTVEIESINQEYSKKVDPDQVWAEAATLFNSFSADKKKGFDYEFNLTDFEELREYNSRFIIETPAMKLIKLYYERPMDGKEYAWKQPKEIAQDLISSNRVRGDFTNRISPESIGYALTALHFEKVSKRISGQPKKVYHVKKL